MVCHVLQGRTRVESHKNPATADAHVEEGHVAVEGQHDQPCLQNVSSCTGRDMTRRLAMLEDRVGGIEATMATALGKLTSILSELSAIKRFYCSEAGVHRTVSGNDRGIPRDDPGPSTLPDRRQCERQKDAREGVPLTSSPSMRQKQTTPQSAERPHAASVDPPPLNQDDVSTHSVRNNRVGGIGSLPQSPLPKPVYSNADMKVSPVGSGLAVPRPPACKEKAPVTATRAGATPATRYKDPPGYEDVSDFGCTSDSACSVPVLQPRKSSVSYYVTRPTIPR